MIDTPTSLTSSVRSVRFERLDHIINGSLVLRQFGACPGHGPRLVKLRPRVTAWAAQGILALLAIGIE